MLKQITRRQMLGIGIGIGTVALALVLPNVSLSKEPDKKATLEQKVEIPFAVESVTKEGKTLNQYSLEPSLYGTHTVDGNVCEPIFQIDSSKSRLIIRPLQKSEKIQAPVYSPKEKETKPKFNDSMKVMDADVLSRLKEPWHEFKQGVYGFFVTINSKETYLGAIDTKGERLNVYRIEKINPDSIPVLTPKQ
jgi:hypothetical protein